MCLTFSPLVTSCPNWEVTEQVSCQYSVTFLHCLYSCFCYKLFKLSKLRSIQHIGTISRYIYVIANKNWWTFKRLRWIKKHTLVWDCISKSAHLLQALLSITLMETTASLKWTKTNKLLMRSWKSWSKRWKPTKNR